MKKKNLSKLSLRRLARRGGVQRMADNVYGDVKDALRTFLITVLRDTVTYTEHAKRKTVSKFDVIAALKLQNKTLYGFGQHNSFQNRSKKKGYGGVARFKTTVCKLLPHKRTTNFMQIQDNMNAAQFGSEILSDMQKNGLSSSFKGLPKELHFKSIRKIPIGLLQKHMQQRIWTKTKFGEAVVELLQQKLPKKMMYMPSLELQINDMDDIGAPMQYNTFPIDSDFVQENVTSKQVVTLIQKAIAASTQKLFIVHLILSWTSTNMSAHANALIINTEKKTLERFEPHGEVTKISNTLNIVHLKEFYPDITAYLQNKCGYAAEQMCAGNALVEFVLEKRIAAPLGLKYISAAHDTCAIQNAGNELFWNFMKPTNQNGLCLLFVLVYYILRIQYPDASRKTLMSEFKKWLSTSPENAANFVTAFVKNVLEAVDDKTHTNLLLISATAD
jgi:histone H4